MFDKVCAFVTIDVFKMALDAGIVESNIYTEEECSTLQSSDVIENVREEQFLEEVFGAASRLMSDAWAQRVATQAKWIFNANDMRKKIFS